MNWIIAHQSELIVAAVVIAWIVLNIMRRSPEPTRQPWRALWYVLEAICVLTGDRWGGTLKTIPGPWRDELPTQAETPVAKSLPPKE